MAELGTSNQLEAQISKDLKLKSANVQIIDNIKR